MLQFDLPTRIYMKNEREKMREKINEKNTVGKVRIGRQSRYFGRPGVNGPRELGGTADAALRLGNL